MGRMLEAREIAEAVTAFLAPKTLRGTRVLITAGPTFETIDAVRGITNRSSGKMGYAVARAALEAGARVTLISGPTSLAAPAGAQRVDVISAREMFEAVKKRVADTDIFISVAAVSDYHVASPRRQKIKRSASKLRLELVPNPDILAWVAARPRPPFCVGFAAETENLHRHAEAKRRAKKVPLIAANLAQRAIGADDNKITLFDDAGVHALPRAPKEIVARQLVAHIAKLYKPASSKR
jgi:phosphopantothenoylcysteine decarboxylase/phosphopantothenate--cysteine ligase